MKRVCAHNHQFNDNNSPQKHPPVLLATSCIAFSCHVARNSTLSRSLSAAAFFAKRTTNNTHLP
eukprot:m.285248 g.285248  ORF g.285248 m.285248 type:complete len:64 (-) comp17771_c0_seq2:8663-8854(-)